jgi:hypothetical protein
MTTSLWREGTISYAVSKGLNKQETKVLKHLIKHPPRRDTLAANQIVTAHNDQRSTRAEKHADGIKCRLHVVQVAMKNDRLIPSMFLKELKLGH